jgi:hypothetical protein
MSVDLRCTFDEALASFVSVLREQHWPTRLLWITRDRISGHHRSHWVFRPNELVSDASSRAFYERARSTKSSIRLDGLAQHEGRTLAYVQDWGGDSQLLNFGVRREPVPVRIVELPIYWTALCVLNRLRGESPWLRSTRITPRATHDSQINEDRRARRPTSR